MKGVFVTGRFRSGSSVIWNLLRHISGVNAFYEPCHDSLIEHLKVLTPVDPSHLGIDNYWQAYADIKEQLPAYYKSSFGVNRLCLSENDEHKSLERYLDFLLSHGSENDMAVLKFNRMDFRLPWLRVKYPNIPIVHIFRNPRDQWVSIFRDNKEIDIDDPALNTGYDLLVWSANLFPYLPRIGSDRIRSSYERHYTLWRISYELGKFYSDYSIDYDHDLLENSEESVKKLLATIDVDKGWLPELLPLIKSTIKNRWKDYHNDQWFLNIEKKCDQFLEEAGLLHRIYDHTIFSKYSNEITPYIESLIPGIIDPLCGVLSQCRSISLENIHALTLARGKSVKYANSLESEVKNLKNNAELAISEKDSLIAVQEQLKIQNNKEITSVTRIVNEQKLLLNSLQQENRIINSGAKNEINALHTIIRSQKEYITSLENEVEKISKVGSDEIKERDNIIDQQKVYGASLEDENEKLRRSANNEIASRDRKIAVQDEYNVSLENENKKISNDARNEIEELGNIYQTQKEYSVSLEREITKLREDVKKEISARDASLEENKRYLLSLESEIKTINISANKEIEIRDKNIEDQKVYSQSLQNQLEKLDEESKRQSEYALSLENEINKLNASSEVEIDARETIIAQQKEFSLSLEAEIIKLHDSVEQKEAYGNSLIQEVDKLTHDADLGIQERDKIISQKENYTESLDSQLKQLESVSKNEIKERDNVIEHKDDYIHSLLNEIKKIRESSALEIESRDNMIRAKDQLLKEMEEKINSSSE